MWGYIGSGLGFKVWGSGRLRDQDCPRQEKLSGCTASQLQGLADRANELAFFKIIQGLGCTVDGRSVCPPLHPRIHSRIEKHINGAIHSEKHNPLFFTYILRMKALNKTPLLKDTPRGYTHIRLM